MRLRRFALAAWIALAAAAADAQIVGAAPDGFIIRNLDEIPLPPEEAWARVLDIAAWWSPGHTYSGDAANLSLDPVAGGCWCETWDGGTVEHGRVLALVNSDTLRLDAALGPLQELGVTGVLAISMIADPDATLILFEYRVSGSSLSGLDQYAAPVEAVLTEQLARLVTPD